MKITICTSSHFNWIYQNLELFWGNKRTQFIHHPMFINEFGNTAFVVEKEDEIIGYLFGFFAQAKPYGYIHSAGVRMDQQREGIGTMLYNHFITICKKSGQKQIKAITTPSNVISINFHMKYGFTLKGDNMINGLLVTKDYAGLNEDRVIKIKNI